MADYRSYCSWRAHPKRVKLVRRLTLEADVAIRELWAWCADPGNGHTDGELDGMSNEDIAIAADNYKGDPDRFVEELVDLKLLDGFEGGYRIHDWLQWQPWAANTKPRSEAGRINSLLRWHKNGKHPNPVKDCPECQSHRNDANGNANGTPPMQIASHRHSQTPVSQSSGSNSGSNSGSDHTGSAVGTAPGSVIASATPPDLVRTETELVARPGVPELSKTQRKRLAEEKVFPVPLQFVDDAIVETRRAAPEHAGPYFVSVLLGIRRERPWPGSEQAAARAAEVDADKPKRQRKKPRRVEPAPPEDPPCTPEEAAAIRDQVKHQLGIEIPEPAEMSASA